MIKIIKDFFGGQSWKSIRAPYIIFGSAIGLTSMIGAFSQKVSRSGVTVYMDFEGVYFFLGLLFLLSAAFAAIYWWRDFKTNK